MGRCFFYIQTAQWADITHLKNGHPILKTIIPQGADAPPAKNGKLITSPTRTEKHKSRRGWCPHQSVYKCQIRVGDGLPVPVLHLQTIALSFWEASPEGFLLYNNDKIIILKILLNQRSFALLRMTIFCFMLYSNPRRGRVTHPGFTLADYNSVIQMGFARRIFAL